MRTYSYNNLVFHNQTSQRSTFYSDLQGIKTLKKYI